jgi:ABC-type multidrug transport system ATPase subunit
MIRATRLTKRYGAVDALVDVDLAVARGDSLGLVGPNGSGRTTLLRIAGTLVAPTSGSIEIDGVDAARHAYRVRPRVAYVASEPLGSEGLRVDEYFRLVLTGRKQSASDEIVGEAIERAGLDRRTRCASLSGGMRQRLALAVALAARPDALLLDDPLRALDSAARGRFVEWIIGAREQGAAIMVATQSDEDVAALCTRVARFDRGRLAGIAAVTRSGPSARSVAAVAVRR